jgi:hypothetical protein
MLAVAKSDKVRGRRKISINIRSKKFGKDVEVFIYNILQKSSGDHQAKRRKEEKT